MILKHFLYNENFLMPFYTITLRTPAIEQNHREREQCSSNNTELNYISKSMTHSHKSTRKLHKSMRQPQKKGLKSNQVRMSETC